MASSNILYNGIGLPEQWPPENLNPESREPMPVPYLESPPSNVPIDVGRQLFVDDFLIEQTDLRRSFHNAEKYNGNPILKPETGLESNRGHKEAILRPGSTACPFDDSVIYDPKDRVFKMWYMAGHEYATALAYSEDGIHWERPKFDVVNGTNCVIPYDSDFRRDSFSPWIDYESGSEMERYKAFFYDKAGRDGQNRGWLYTSADGIHWQRRERLRFQVGDNTSMFYNPFRKKWVLSIRKGLSDKGRARYYREHSDFLRLAELGQQEPVFWTRADRHDIPDPEVQTEVPEMTQLYAVAAAGYESIMLGVFTIHYGPHNSICREGGFPKLTQLKLAYSRDGFHWYRPDREDFISATKNEGDWDRGYLRAAGGGCLVVGDRLYFYYCGFSGVSMDGENDIYAGGSTHLAFLRRDGFASMDADKKGGFLTTRSVIFSGKYLFVNLEARAGEMRAEILDQNDSVIEPFSSLNCVPAGGDKTSMQVLWRGVDDLSALTGRPVKIRFHLTRGKLYSFWISVNRSGTSNGYVAAGGPGFDGSIDT